MNPKEMTYLSCCKCGKLAETTMDDNYNKDLPEGWIDEPKFNRAICDVCKIGLEENNGKKFSQQESKN